MQLLLHCYTQSKEYRELYVTWFFTKCNIKTSMYQNMESQPNQYRRYIGIFTFWAIGTISVLSFENFWQRNWSFSCQNSPPWWAWFYFLYGTILPFESRNNTDVISWHQLKEEQAGRAEALVKDSAGGNLSSFFIHILTHPFPGVQKSCCCQKIHA